MAEHRIRMPSTCPALTRLLTDRPSCRATFSFRSASLLVVDDAQRNGAEAKQPDEVFANSDQAPVGVSVQPFVGAATQGVS